MSSENRVGIDEGRGHWRNSRQNGAIATGALISWLGFAFYLSSLGLLHGSAWLGLALVGIGGATVLAGFVRNVNGVRHGAMASFAIGVAVLLSGIWFLTPSGEFWEGFWPLAVIFAGASIIISVLTRDTEQPGRHGHRTDRI